MKKIIVSSLIFALVLSGCGAKDNESSSANAPLSSTTASSSTAAIALTASNFTVPEADKAYLQSQPSAAIARSKTQDQLTLEAASIMYPIDRIWQYNELLPHPELFCPEPTDPEFLTLAAKLGGFKKSSHIYIEPDATAPTVQSGLMTSFYQRRFLESVASPSAGGGGSVTIQRPDTVGTSGNKAFYLSNTYGLVAVDYSAVPFAAPKPSCAFPLPGYPENFVITDTHIYAIFSGSYGRAAAVLQFDISGDQPVYVSGQLFDHHRIIDARLFNDTLALYMETYELQPAADPANTSTAGGAAAISPVIYPSGRSLGYELATLATLPVLTPSHSETLLAQGVSNPPLNSPADIEQIYRHSYFNSFLSASGEYLVVTETVSERHFDGYLQKSAYRCEEYKVTETPYQYCHTKWKRVENPDYQPPSSPGIVQCNSDLASCLSLQLPRVNRYIFEPDGKECFDSIQYSYSCLSGRTYTYDVPQFHYETKTQFTAFRFSDDRFIKLDNQMANLKGSDIVVDERPFVLPGQVKKHDHIQFNNGYLYVISDDQNDNNTVKLNTLAIVGNSAMNINQLTLQSGSRYSTLNAAFSAERIYISDGSNKASAILTVSLANPLSPRLENSIKLPSQLQQMLFAGDQVLGLGQVTFTDNTYQQNYTIGNVTSFSLAGQEQNNVLLGADHRYFYTPASYDDQVLSYSSEFQRLMVPYVTSYPLPGVSGPNSENRLSIISSQNGDIQEQATLALPQLTDRAININADNALSFSSDFIHHLSRDNGWGADVIFDGAIPDSIYYSRQYPTQVQKYLLGSNIIFKLIDSSDKASGALLDSQSLSRAGSQVCMGEQILFDRDRVVIVREAANQYISYQDCPSEHNQVTKEFIGYRITANKLAPITDRSELETIYIQSRWNLICVTDLNEPEGEFLEGYTLDDVADLSCYTYDQFMTLLYPSNSF